MAKKIKTEAEEIIAPDPLPKPGDGVEYIWPATGKTNGAKVLAVYEGFDGRLLDLEVDSGAGVVTVKSAPWRDAADNAGNTWHWPE